MNTQKAIDKAERDVATLESRIDELQAAIINTEARMDDARLVDRVKLSGQKRDLAGALVDVQGELEAARAAVDDARKAHAGAVKQVEKLWKAERKQIERVVGLVDGLQAALDDLGNTQRQLAGFGAMHKSNPLDLVPFLANIKARWRMVGWWHAEGSLYQRQSELPRRAAVDLEETERKAQEAHAASDARRSGADRDPEKEAAAWLQAFGRKG